MTRSIASTWRAGDWRPKRDGGATPLLGPVAARPHSTRPWTKRPSRRWPRVFAVSAGLHVLVIAALALFAIERPPPADDTVLPALEISLEPGPRAPAAGLNPSVESQLGPPIPEKALSGGRPITPAPGPPPVAPLAPQSDTPPAAAPQTVTASIPPSEPATAPAPLSAAPPPSVAQSRAAQAPLAPPPVPLSPPDDTTIPLPPVPPTAPPPPAPPTQLALARPPELPKPLLERPLPSPARPMPIRPMTPAAPRRRAEPESGFPRPMNLSLGRALGSLGGGFARDHEQDGPVARSEKSYGGGASAQTDITGDNLGPEWLSLLHAWVDEHKYYPQEAAENGEDGTSVVRVVIRRDGRVQSVELTSRSGSQWLDIATQALFRDQRLPAFPPTDDRATATIFFSMHYILIR